MNTPLALLLLSHPAVRLPQGMLEVLVKQAVDDGDVVAFQDRRKNDLLWDDFRSFQSGTCKLKRRNLG